MKRKKIKIKTKITKNGNFNSYNACDISNCWLANVFCNMGQKKIQQNLLIFEKIFQWLY